MTLPTYREGSAQSGTSSSASVPITKPPGLALDDVMDLHVVSEGPGSVPFVMPEGWVRYFIWSNNDLTVRRYWKLANGADVAAGSFPGSQPSGDTRPLAWQILAMEGVHPTAPVDMVREGTSVLSTSVRTGDIATNGPDRLIIASFGALGTAAYSSSDVTERAESSRTDASGMIGHVNKATRGSVGQLLATLSTSRGAKGVATAYRPADDPDPLYARLIGTPKRTANDTGTFTHGGTLPDGYQPDELILASIVTRGDDAVFTSNNGVFTPLESIYTGTGELSMHLFYAPAPTDGSTSALWTSDIRARSLITMVRVTGQDVGTAWIGNILSLYADPADGVLTFDAPGLTLGVDEELYLAFGATDYSVHEDLNRILLRGPAQSSMAYEHGTLSENKRSVLYWRTYESDGTTGAQEFSRDETGNVVGILLGVRPAPPVSATPTQEIEEVGGLDSDEEFGLSNVELVAQTYVDAEPVQDGEEFGTITVVMGDDPTDPTRYGLTEYATELVTERTLESKKFDTGFGTVVEAIGSRMHYLEDKVMKDIDLDNEVVEGDPTLYRMDKHALKVEIRSTGSNRGMYLTEKATGKGIQIHLPADATEVGKNYVSFPWHGTTWTYSNRKKGLKLTSGAIEAPRGEQSYVFQYSLLGGATHPQATSDGELEGDSYLIKRMFAIGANGEWYDMGAWAVDTFTQQIACVFNDADIPADAYPYVIDPTTDITPVTLPEHDGEVFREDSTTYEPTTASQVSPAGATQLRIMASRYLNASSLVRYRKSLALMRFNTSHIPSDLIIQQAWLRLYITNVQVAPGDGFTIGGDEEPWVPPVSSGMYTATEDYSLFSQIDAATIQANGYLDLPLSNLAAINRSGYTGIRLFSGVTRVPTGLNEVHFASHEHPTLPEPTLFVEYTEGPSFKSATSAHTGSGANFIDVPYPADVAVGDTALVFLHGGYSGSPTPTTRATITPPPAASDGRSWNLVQEMTNVANGRTQLWHKKLTAADLSGPVPRWSWGDNRIYTAIMGLYPLADPTIAASMVRFESAGAGLIPGPDSLATTGPAQRVVLFYGAQVNAALSPQVVGTMTERLEVRSPTSLFFPQMLADFILPTAQAIGVREADIVSASSTNRMAIGVVLKAPTLIYAEGIPSDEAFGVASVEPQPRYTDVEPVQSGEEFGMASIELRVTQTSGIPSGEEFGMAQVLPGITMISSIQDGEVFGMAEVIPGPTTVNMDPVQNGETFGQATIVHEVDILNGIPSGETFGTILVEVEPSQADITIQQEKIQSAMLSGKRGRRMFEPRLWVSNINGDQLQEITGAIEGGTVDFSNYRDNTWALSINMNATDALDPIHDYVLVTYDAWSDQDAPQQFPMGLYRFEFPTGDDLPQGPTWNLNGLSLEFLMFRKAAINGYKVGKQASVFNAIRDILQIHGIPTSRLTIPPDLADKILPQGTRYDPVKDGDNSMFIRIANDILRRAGFGALQTTAEGQFFFNDIVPLEEKYPAVFYGPEELGGDDMIHYVGIPYSPSYDRFANQVIVYNSNTTTNTTADTTVKSDKPDPPIKWTETNTNPDSPVSVLPVEQGGLGYTVTKIVQLEDITDLAAAKKVARAELSKASGYHVERKIATLLDPRREPDEAYKVEAYNAMGQRIIAGNWNQVNVSMPLSKNPNDWIMSHTITRSEKL